MPDNILTEPVGTIADGAAVIKRWSGNAQNPNEVFQGAQYSTLFNTFAGSDRTALEFVEFDGAACHLNVLSVNQSNRVDLDFSRDLSDEAEADLAVVVYHDESDTSWVLALSEDTDGSDPYRWTVANLFSQWRQRFGSEDRKVTVVVVVKSRVDLTTLDVIAAGGEGAENLLLTAGLAGTTRLALHTGVPTAANEVSGGSYASIDVAETEWTIETVGRFRRASNNVKHTFPVPTGAWGTINYIALWTGDPQVSGSEWLWYGATLPFKPVAETEEVSVPIGTIGIQF